MHLHRSNIQLSDGKCCGCIWSSMTGAFWPRYNQHNGMRHCEDVASRKEMKYQPLAIAFTYALAFCYRSKVSDRLTWWWYDVPTTYTVIHYVKEHNNEKRSANFRHCLWQLGALTSTFSVATSLISVMRNSMIGLLNLKKITFISYSKYTHRKTHAHVTVIRGECAVSLLKTQYAS